MFTRRGSGCIARLDAVEAEVLRDVLNEVMELVADEIDRDDPVVARMFPDHYPDDLSTSVELHRYTDDDLKATKLEQAGAVLSALPRGGGLVRLDEEEAETWLRALTDARLALGMRLDVRDDTNLESEIDDAVLADPTSPRVQQLSVYAFLTLLQASLVEALAGY
jgi:Domain of unknown function (DUF2017)